MRARGVLAKRTSTAPKFVPATATRAEPRPPRDPAGSTSVSGSAVSTAALTSRPFTLTSTEGSPENEYSVIRSGWMPGS